MYFSEQLVINKKGVEKPRYPCLWFCPGGLELKDVNMSYLLGPKEDEEITIISHGIYDDKWSEKGEVADLIDVSEVNKAQDVIDYLVSYRIISGVTESKLATVLQNAPRIAGCSHPPTISKYNYNKCNGGEGKKPDT